MACGSSLEFRGSNFNHRVREYLKRIDGLALHEIDHLQAQCENKSMQVILVRAGSVDIGYMIVAWIYEDVLVFVVTACVLDNVDKTPLRDDILAMCSAWASDQGAKRIRFWTQRDGLVRYGAKVGFEVKHVLEKSI